jgi:hypothetical protein
MPEMGSKKSLQLHEIVPSDLEEVARFIGRLSKSKTPLALAVERLSWILLENPARTAADPLGWLLRNPSGELAVCMCCAPQKFCLGQSTFTVSMANSFYVDDRFRGAGTSIFLKYLQLGRRYPLFVSSANATVAAMWQKLGGYPLGNSDHEVLGILRWPPMLAESLYRKTSSGYLARFASAIASPFFRARRQSPVGILEGELVPLKNAEDAAAICAQHHSDRITNCRDAPFLKWRYFSHSSPMTRLFHFRPGNGEKGDFMVAVQLQHRGYNQQIRALQVLDIWGEPDPHTVLAIASCLWREYCDQIDLLVFRCLSLTHLPALQSRGFKVRSFPAPIAWCIDKYGLLPSKEWYLVPADGDMFL